MLHPSLMWDVVAGNGDPNMQPQSAPKENAVPDVSQRKVACASAIDRHIDVLTSVSQIAARDYTVEASKDANQPGPQSPSAGSSGDGGCAFELDVDMCCDDEPRDYDAHYDLTEAGDDGGDGWGADGCQNRAEGGFPMAEPLPPHADQPAQYVQPMHAVYPSLPDQTDNCGYAQNLDSIGHQHEINEVAIGRLQLPDDSHQIAKRDKVCVVLLVRDEGADESGNTTVEVSIALQADSDCAAADTCMPGAGNEQQCSMAYTGGNLGPAENLQHSREPQEAPHVPHGQAAIVKEASTEAGFRFTADMPAAGSSENDKAKTPAVQPTLPSASPQNQISWGKPFHVKVRCR